MTTAATAQSIAFAERLGVDPRLFLQAIEGAPDRQRVRAAEGQRDPRRGLQPVVRRRRRGQGRRPDDRCCSIAWIPRRIAGGRPPCFERASADGHGDTGHGGGAVRVPCFVRQYGWPAAALVLGIAVGVSTSYLQGELPGSWNTLANSGAVWTVVAFAIAAAVLRHAEPRRSLAGLAALLGEVLGYYAVASPIRASRRAPSERTLWIAAALVGRPACRLRGVAVSPRPAGRSARCRPRDVRRGRGGGRARCGAHLVIRPPRHGSRSCSARWLRSCCSRGQRGIRGAPGRC